MKKKASAIDWIKFIFVMLIFIIGMVYLILYKVHTPWVWAIYIGVWTWAEMTIAKNIHLKWWVWFWIILGLCCLDYLILLWLG